MSAKRKCWIAKAILCLYMVAGQAQTVSPVARVANMFANTEICAQNYPAHASNFLGALDIWKSKNRELYQDVLRYPGFKQIVSDARKEILASYETPTAGNPQPKTLEQCYGYANSIKALGEGYL